MLSQVERRKRRTMTPPTVYARTPLATTPEAPTTCIGTPLLHPSTLTPTTTASANSTTTHSRRRLIFPKSGGNIISNYHVSIRLGLIVTIILLLVSALLFGGRGVSDVVDMDALFLGGSIPSTRKAKYDPLCRNTLPKPAYYDRKVDIKSGRLRQGVVPPEVRRGPWGEGRKGDTAPSTTFVYSVHPALSTITHICNDHEGSRGDVRRLVDKVMTARGVESTTSKWSDSLCGVEGTKSDLGVDLHQLPILQPAWASLYTAASMMGSGGVVPHHHHPFPSPTSTTPTTTNNTYMVEMSDYPSLRTSSIRRTPSSGSNIINDNDGINNKGKKSVLVLLTAQSVRMATSGVLLLPSPIVINIVQIASSIYARHVRQQHFSSATTDTSNNIIPPHIGVSAFVSNDDGGSGGGGKGVDSSSSGPYGWLGLSGGQGELQTIWDTISTRWLESWDMKRNITTTTSSSSSSAKRLLHGTTVSLVSDESSSSSSTSTSVLKVVSGDKTSKNRWCNEVLTIHRLHLVVPIPSEVVVGGSGGTADSGSSITVLRIPITVSIISFRCDDSTSSSAMATTPFHSASTTSTSAAPSPLLLDSFATLVHLATTTTLSPRGRHPLSINHTNIVVVRETTVLHKLTGGHHQYGHGNVTSNDDYLYHCLLQSDHVANTGCDVNIAHHLGGSTDGSVYSPEDTLSLLLAPITDNSGILAVQPVVHTPSSTWMADQLRATHTTPTSTTLQQQVAMNIAIKLPLSSSGVDSQGLDYTVEPVRLVGYAPDATRIKVSANPPTTLTIAPPPPPPGSPTTTTKTPEEIPLWKQFKFSITTTMESMVKSVFRPGTALEGIMPVKRYHKRESRSRQAFGLPERRPQQQHYPEKSSSVDLLTSDMFAVRADAFIKVNGLFSQGPIGKWVPVRGDVARGVLHRLESISNHHKKNIQSQGATTTSEITKTLVQRNHDVRLVTRVLVDYAGTNAGSTVHSSTTYNDTTTASPSTNLQLSTLQPHTHLRSEEAVMWQLCHKLRLLKLAPSSTTTLPHHPPASRNRIVTSWARAVKLRKFSTTYGEDGQQKYNHQYTPTSYFLDLQLQVEAVENDMHISPGFNNSTKKSRPPWVEMNHNEDSPALYNCMTPLVYTHQQATIKAGWHIIMAVIEETDTSSLSLVDAVALGFRSFLRQQLQCGGMTEWITQAVGVEGWLTAKVNTTPIPEQLSKLTSSWFGYESDKNAKKHRVSKADKNASVPIWLTGTHSPLGGAVYRSAVGRSRPENQWERPHKPITGDAVDADPDLAGVLTSMSDDVLTNTIHTILGSQAPKVPSARHKSSRCDAHDDGSTTTLKGEDNEEGLGGGVVNATIGMALSDIVSGIAEGCFFRSRRAGDSSSTSSSCPKPRSVDTSSTPMSLLLRCNAAHIRQTAKKVESMGNPSLEKSLKAPLLPWQQWLVRWIGSLILSPPGGDETSSSAVWPSCEELVHTMSSDNENISGVPPTNNSNSSNHSLRNATVRRMSPRPEEDGLGGGKLSILSAWDTLTRGVAPAEVIGVTTIYDFIQTTSQSSNITQAGSISTRLVDDMNIQGIWGSAAISQQRQRIEGNIERALLAHLFISNLPPAVLGGITDNNVQASAAFIHHLLAGLNNNSIAVVEGVKMLRVPVLTISSYLRVIVKKMGKKKKPAVFSKIHEEALRCVLNLLNGLHEKRWSLGFPTSDAAVLAHSERHFRCINQWMTSRMMKDSSSTAIPNCEGIVGLTDAQALRVVIPTLCEMATTLVDKTQTVRALSLHVLNDPPSSKRSIRDRVSFIAANFAHRSKFHIHSQRPIVPCSGILTEIMTEMGSYLNPNFAIPLHQSVMHADRMCDPQPHLAMRVERSWTTYDPIRFQLPRYEKWYPTSEIELIDVDEAIRLNISKALQDSGSNLRREIGNELRAVMAALGTHSYQLPSGFQDPSSGASQSSQELSLASEVRMVTMHSPPPYAIGGRASVASFFNSNKKSKDNQKKIEAMEIQSAEGIGAALSPFELYLKTMHFEEGSRWSQPSVKLETTVQIYQNAKEVESPKPEEEEEEEVTGCFIPVPRKARPLIEHKYFCRTMHESSTIPQSWATSAKNCDQIWVPSLFTRQTFLNGMVKVTYEAIALFDTADSKPQVINNMPHRPIRLNCSDGDLLGDCAVRGSTLHYTNMTKETNLTALRKLLTVAIEDYVSGDFLPDGTNMLMGQYWKAPLNPCSNSPGSTCVGGGNTTRALAVITSTQSLFDADKILVMPEVLDTSESVDPTMGVPDTSTIINDVYPTSWNKSLASPDNWCSRRCYTPSGGNLLPLNQTARFHSNFKWEPRKGWGTLVRGYVDAFMGSNISSVRNAYKPTTSRRLEPMLLIQTKLFFPRMTDEDRNNGGKAAFLRRLINEELRIHFGIGEQFKNHSIYNVTSAPNFPCVCFSTTGRHKSQINQLYSVSDVFVLPTRGEGWGLPLAEAMVLGKRIISTRWSGATEFLDMGSFPLANRITPEKDAAVGLVSVASVDEIEVSKFPAIYIESGMRYATPSWNHLSQLLSENHQAIEAERCDFQGNCMAHLETSWENRNRISSHYSEEGVGTLLVSSLAASSLN